MIAGELCTRKIVMVAQEATALEAAKLMLEHKVGCVVVVEKKMRGNVPIGIVTERDLVLKIVAGDARAGAIGITAVMSEKLMTAREDESVFDVLQRMHTKSIRHMPVMNAQEELIGILAADDVLAFFAKEGGDFLHK